MDIKRNIPVFIFFSAFLFGFLFTGYMYKDEIKGMILSGVIEYEITEGLITKSSTRLRTGRYSSSKAINIIYAYNVNNNIYTSRLVTFAADYDDIEYYLDKYPVNKRVPVYYQKDDPSFAVLEPNKKNWFVVLRPFIWILAGALLFLLLYLRTKLTWLNDLMDLFERAKK